MDIAALAELLHETADHHDPYEKSHPPHNWWDWYAAFLDARQHGSTADEASTAADQYMEGLLDHVPGRANENVAALAELLHETSIRHGAFEAITPPHNWWDWYAAYLHARQDGADPDPAAAAADRYMAEVKHVVPKT
ncbi:MAG TPA: hypothetical protein VH373_00395 [Jatrophihabitantaceae bacterium]|jgi:hypothetical protein